MDWEKIRKDITLIIEDHYLNDEDSYTDIIKYKVNETLDEVIDDIWTYFSYKEKNE